MPNSLVLGLRPISIEDVEDVARREARVEFAEPARSRIRQGRVKLEERLAAGDRIYGVNTGVGGNIKFALDAEQTERFQHNLMNHLSCGTGAPLPRDVVRAAMLLRLATFSRGSSAVRWDLVSALEELLNHGIAYALGELARALRQRFPGQRLVSVMQPRATGGRSWIYQSELPSALSNFDKIILTHPYEHNPPPETLWRNDPFQLDLLVSDLTRLGADLTVAATIEDLPETIAGELKNGDVIVLTLPEQYSHFVATIEEALEKSLEQANI